MAKRLICVVIMVLLFLSSGRAFAIDSEQTRLTLTNLAGVYVTIEDGQPNIKKYAQKAELTKEQLQRDVEQGLTKNGIRVLTREQWLKTRGNPVFYVNVNTHETEKYWYAYDVRVELHQTVYMEANPKVRILATTWSMNMTGTANIGNLHIIKGDVGVLVDRFVKAYKAVNGKQ